MRKLLWILGLTCMLIACKGSSDDKNEVEEQQESSQVEREIKTYVFRSDGFRPGIASEWIELDLDILNAEILRISYYSTEDEKPLEISIQSQTFYDDEIYGIVGTLLFPDDVSTIGFGLIEDRFILDYDEFLTQEFYWEE